MISLISRNYFSIYNLVSFVKLLLGSLPAVVSPEIIRWILTYGFFKHLEETTGNLMFWERIWLSGDEFVSGSIVASLRTTHLYVEYGIIHLSHDSLATRKHGSLRMVEERKPKMDVLPLGTLVADIAKDTHHAFSLVIYEIAENIFLRHHDAVCLMRANALEELIEGMVAQWVIDEAHHAILGQLNAHAG